MKWSHADPVQVQNSVWRYIQGRKIGIGAIGVLVTSGAILYGIGWNITSSAQQSDDQINKTSVRYTRGVADQARQNRVSDIEVRVTDNSQTVAGDAKVSPAAPAVSGQVQVDDQTIAIPDSGTVQKQVVTDNGTTSVEMSVNSTSNTQENSSQRTTLDINVESSSNNSVESGQSEDEPFFYYDDY